MGAGEGRGGGKRRARVTRGVRGARARSGDKADGDGARAISVEGQWMGLMIELTHKLVVLPMRRNSQAWWHVQMWARCLGVLGFVDSHRGRDGRRSETKSS